MINEIKLQVCDECKTVGYGQVQQPCLQCGQVMKPAKFKREFINHCVPVNGVHAPFCTGHESTDMTYDEINNMPAGLYMDGLIAQHVTKLSYILYDGTDKDAEDLIPHYSTDIAAAWEVVSHLESDFAIDLGNNRNGWTVKIFSRKVAAIFNSNADTAQLAICRAALLAKVAE